MSVSLVAAMSANRVIGRGNALPWSLKPDLRRFRRLTMGGTLVMGRRTFESIGRPLDGRTTVVLTRRDDLAPAGVLVARSIDEALSLAPGPEVFIAGGAEIFRQTLGLADRLHLTLIEKDFEGDAFFPEFDAALWRVSGDEAHPGEEGGPAYRFLTYDRR